MVDYHYSFARRVIFIALLVLIVAVALVPAVSKGTVNVRVSTISAPSVVQHVNLKISQLELHTSGLPSTIGWVSVTSGLPTIDLVNQQGIPSTITTSIQTGRYDGVRITISQATLIEGGVTPRTLCSASCSQVEANVTTSVPPNGYGDILLVVSPDYSGLLNQPGSLTLNIIYARGS